MAATAQTLHVSQLTANHAGARYQGEISIATGRRDGHGKYLYPNAYFTYEGQWLDGKKHGQGRLSFADGGFYEGSFENGEIVGDGSQKWADGTLYVGQFLDGAKHGQGEYKKADGTHYKGSWQHGKYSGEGTLTLPNGDSYSGGFSAHRYHGHGALTQPSAASSYVGLFEGGLFEGEGELHERGGAFTYTGQFHRGMMAGQGAGLDKRTGVSCAGKWAAGMPAPCAFAWDLGVPEEEDSYLPMAEYLKTEAANQLHSMGDDKKGNKGKKDAKKLPPGSPAEDPPPDGPELKLCLGEELPQVSLRLTSSGGDRITTESGRRFRVTMYKEKKVISKEDPNEAEVLRRPVRFNDRRETYVDPLDEAQPPSGKATPQPPPKPDDGPDEEVQVGDEARDGVMGMGGETILGGSEEWFVPMHLQPAIYWLRVEDVTDFTPGSLWQDISPLEVPVRVAAPEGK